MGIRQAGKRGLLDVFEQLRGVDRVTSYFGALAPPPDSVSYYEKLGALTMALNDQYGDCTIAGIEHVWQMQAVLAGTSFAYPGDPATKSTYFGLTGGQDTGLQLSTVVAAASNTGLFGHKLLGAGSIHPHDVTTLKQTIDIFGCVYAAGSLPSTAESQFENQQPWTLEPGLFPGTDGHCFDLVGYDLNWLYAYTWGGIQKVSYNWWRCYGVQGYALISDFFRAANGPTGNYTQMAADLQVLVNAKS